MVNIVGAGLAGLLAANMLAHRRPTIHEAQPQLPNNHSAVLRFRTSQIGDITHIPFRKVTMIKCSATWLNPVADALAYSHKNTGTYRSDRSVIAGTVTDDRYIAPDDLIAQLATNANIQFGSKYTFTKPDGWQPTISTIPMPQLMQALDYKPRPSFDHSSGVNIRARIRNCDAYASVLVPDPMIPFSRISLTGDEVIAECYQDTDETPQFIMRAVADILGMRFQDFFAFSRHEQKYAKINPINEDERKQFMFHATDQWGIFSLGRFATWRPGLLLDDLVKDIRLINGWIQTSDRYAIARHR